MRRSGSHWAGSQLRGWALSIAPCWESSASVFQNASWPSGSHTRPRRQAVTVLILANRCKGGPSVLMPSMEEKGVAERSSEPVLIQRILAGKKDLFHDLIRPHERGAFLLAYSTLR